MLVVGCKYSSVFLECKHLSEVTLRTGCVMGSGNSGSSVILQDYPDKGYPVSKRQSVLIACQADTLSALCERCVVMLSHFFLVNTFMIAVKCMNIAPNFQ